LWASVDPSCEEDYAWSPYNYVRDNPLVYNDPDGRFWNYVIGAAVGAATDYGFQVAGNLIQGKSVGDAFTDVDSKSIVASAVIGAGGVGLANIAKKGYQAYKGAKAVQQSTSVATKTITKAEQLAINRTVGKAAEIGVTKELVAKYGAKNVGSQITARFKDGTKVVFDNVVVKDGKAVLINETKSGAANLSTQQARFFDGGEAVTFVGEKAQQLKLLGQTINNTKVATKITTVAN